MWFDRIKSQSFPLGNYCFLQTGQPSIHAHASWMQGHEKRKAKTYSVYLYHLHMNKSVQFNSTVNRNIQVCSVLILLEHRIRDCI